MKPLKITVVSGGTGASGEQLVRTILAQFETADIPVEIIPHVKHIDQIQDIVERVANENSLVVHTLVDLQLRHALSESLHKHHVTAVDLVGKAIGLIERRLGQKPLGTPGRYRKLREDYFKRIDALEFAIDHDDGRRPHELPLAEIVLIGVSRVGKTPLSMYLATHGWKVANVPLAQNVKPPAALFEIDARHVIGLRLEPGQLLELRHKRARQLGMGHGSYQEPAEIYEELDFADRLFRRGHFRVVDMTDKPIEEAAEEIISKISQQNYPRTQ